DLHPAIIALSPTDVGAALAASIPPGYVVSRMGDMAAEPTIWERVVRPRERDGFPVMAGHLPGVGHFPTLYKDAVGAIERATRDLGPCFKVDFGFGQWYLFCSGGEGFDLLKHRSVG